MSPFEKYVLFHAPKLARIFVRLPRLFPHALCPLPSPLLACMAHAQQKLRFAPKAVIFRLFYSALVGSAASFLFIFTFRRNEELLIRNSWRLASVVAAVTSLVGLRVVANFFTFSFSSVPEMQRKSWPSLQLVFCRFSFSPVVLLVNCESTGHLSRIEKVSQSWKISEYLEGWSAYMDFALDEWEPKSFLNRSQ